MTSPADGALIVFARAPRPGRVKSRLAASIGTVAAADVYAGLLERALAVAQGSRYCRRFLYCADRDEVDYFQSRLGDGAWRIAAQSGGDLGERMFNAYTEVLAGAPFAVLIGSDIADSTSDDLDRAYAALADDRRTAVLGPAQDGGYWLLGLSAVQRSFFTGIPWSTASVAKRTEARLRSAGYTVLTLPPRRDVDVAGDLDPPGQRDQGR